jgi:hypothetical protein
MRCHRATPTGHARAEFGLLLAPGKTWDKQQEEKFFSYENYPKPDIALNALFAGSVHRWHFLFCQPF